MNESRENATLFIRLVCIALSSAFIALPQILWSMYGYQGIPLIALESFFIVLGFASLLCALILPLPRFLSTAGKKMWAYVESNVDRNSIFLKLAPIGILGYALYLVVPAFLSRLELYHNVPFAVEAMLAVLTIFILALLAAIHHLESKNHRDLANWYYLPIAALALTWAAAFWYGSPAYPTDEMVIDFYSAHLVLGGVNPYIASNTSGVFSFFHTSFPGYPLSIGTPILTGGLVTSLSYPALSIFSYIPAHLLGTSPTATLLPLYAIPAVLIFLVYSREKYRLISLLPVFILLLNPSYLIQTGLGYPDIVWVAFLLISIYTYKRPAISGLTMGLAMAVKQVPWLVFPFFLIFIFRELGKKDAILWAIFAAIAFIIPNLPFIASSPYAFLLAIISPGFFPLMGIGFGPSQLSFLGIVSLSRGLFTVIVACLSASFIILYIFYYEKLKFAFLAFPLLIFLFNYRFLLDYVVFWPVIALILPAMMKGAERENKAKNPVNLKFPWKNKAIALALAIFLIGVPAAFQEQHVQANGFVISNIAVSSTSSDNITAITLNLGLDGSNLTYGQVMYRIIPWSSMPNLNGYLWHCSNFTAEKGAARITLVPDNSLQQIPSNGRYRIIAYYGGISTTTSFIAHYGNIT